MSAPDLMRLAQLLEAVEAEDRSNRAVAWLLDGGTFPEDLGIDDAKRMALMSHLTVAKKSPSKRVKKEAARAIHSLKTQGHEAPEAPKSGGWALGSEEREIPQPVGLLGLPQGDGYFPYILVAYNRT